MMKASAQRFLDGVFRAMELPVDIHMEYNREFGSLDIDFSERIWEFSSEREGRPWILFSTW